MLYSEIETKLAARVSGLIRRILRELPRRWMRHLAREIIVELDDPVFVASLVSENDRFFNMPLTEPTSAAAPDPGAPAHRQTVLGQRIAEKMIENHPDLLLHLLGSSDIVLEAAVKVLITDADERASPHATRQMVDALVAQRALVVSCLMSPETLRQSMTAMRAPGDEDHPASDDTTVSRRLLQKLAKQNPRLLAADIEPGEKVLEELVASILQQQSYAQEGEDLVLTRLFAGKTDGFFVDVGAHHPIRFSNTYLLYRLGWRGINIDATPNSMALFNCLRPNDINIECFVASDSGPRVLHVFNEGALNTSSPSLAAQRLRENVTYSVVEKRTLMPRRLESILDEHLPEGKAIDLLNVDAEGADLDVLRSNNWRRHRPTYVLVEVLHDPEERIEISNDVSLFLKENGYELFTTFFNGVLFKDRS